VDARDRLDDVTGQVRGEAIGLSNPLPSGSGRDCGRRRGNPARRWAPGMRDRKASRPWQSVDGWQAEQLASQLVMKRQKGYDRCTSMPNEVRWM
jgi:hypothetical protein